MRLCPRCRSEFSDTSLEVCPFDNWGLVTPEDYYEAEGDPLLGALLAGRFRIVGRVGVGAMGTVYRAIQASVERAVALKVLRPDLTKDPDTAARFHREAHATSALKHPNTVTLYDFGQTGEGYLYIAMELLEGRLLGKILKEDGALSIELALRIVIQISRSLAEAHRKGIVHRDLKPDNIMLAQVEGQEVVKVLDFGIAKVIRGERRIDALETQAGTVFGTPRYMSPEQAQSKPLDARSDLYSLGVIFYQMLTGHAPFEDSDAVVVMARHIKTKPRRPSDVRPDLKIPPRLERLVQRLMEKDRNKRPQSSEELIDALTKFNQGQDDDFALFTERSSPSAIRRVLPFVAAAAISLILAVGAVIAYALTRPDSQGELPAQRDVPNFVPNSKFSEPHKAEVDVGIPIISEQDEVSVTLDSEPQGAFVIRDGKRLGVTPMMLTEPTGTEVPYVLELEGFETKTQVILFSGEQSSNVVSLRQERVIGKRRPGWFAKRGHKATGKESPTTGQQNSSSGGDSDKQPRYGRFDDR